MGNEVDNKAFDLMTELADQTDVNLSEDPGYHKGYKKANKSFDRFWKKLSHTNPELTVHQLEKIKEFWEQGGKPIINIQKKGTKFGLQEDVNRASFSRLRDSYGADQINIFEHKLLDHFLAEISHSTKYARKPNETKANWIKRRNELDNLASRERERYGEGVYGKELKGKKYFPIEVSRTYSIGIKNGKEIVVDDEGNEYPDIAVPAWHDVETNEEGVVSSKSRTTSWFSPMEHVEFNPETRLGVGGEKLTHEFEAHSVIQDSLSSVLKYVDEWEKIH